jgi:hypothetical protein
MKSSPEFVDAIVPPTPVASSRSHHVRSESHPLPAHGPRLSPTASENDLLQTVKGHDSKDTLHKSRRREIPASSNTHASRATEEIGVEIPGAPVHAPLEENHGTISIHVNNLRQLYNTLDPAPFRERDLDARAAQYIEEYAADVEKETICIKIFVDQLVTPDEEISIVQAIAYYYEAERLSSTKLLKGILREGRLSMIIGLAVLAVCLSVLVFFDQSASSTDYGSQFLSNSLMVLSWVALWKPIETLLYKWWPLVIQQRLLARIRDARVEVICPKLKQVTTLATMTSPDMMDDLFI